MVLPALPRESLLVSTSSALVLLDLAHPNTHSPVTTFKPYTSGAAPHALSFVPPSPLGGLEGLVAWGEAGRKTLIHVASLAGLPSSSSTSAAGAAGGSAGTATVRWIPPQAISVLAFSPDGSLVVAGCEDGRAYLWEVGSGKLRCTWEPHFRRVSALRWSGDGSFVATGGEDGRICVWNLVGLYHPGAASAGPSSGSTSSSAQHQASPQAYATFTSHLLPITALKFSPEVGISSGTGLKLWSASRDGTIRVWDLRSRTQLSNFIIGSGGSSAGEINDIVIDPTGRFAFAAWSPVSTTGADASSNNTSSSVSAGKVFRIDLYRRVSSSGQSHTADGDALGFEAAGGRDELLGDGSKSAGGRSDIGIIALPSATMSPTCLSLAPSSSAHLLVGTANPPSVLVVDVRSSQIVRTIPFFDGSNSSVAAAGRVTNLISLHRPVIPAGEAVTAQQTGMVPRFVTPTLDRMVSSVEATDSKAQKNTSSGGVGADEDVEEEDEGYWAILPDRTPSSAGVGTSFPDLLGQQVRSSLDAGAATSSTAAAANAEQERRIAELEERNRSLEAQLKRAAQINDEIWKATVADGAGGGGGGGGGGAKSKKKTTAAAGEDATTPAQASVKNGGAVDASSKATSKAKSKRKR
ncbi:unnamed protein product [Parajaminaea phylloscopi]